MKTKDYLIAGLGPLPVLLIPLIGNLLSPENWKWTWSDFVVGWAILAGPLFFYRLLATRQRASLPYRLGAALAAMAAFLITWISLAVQIIGDHNPGNRLYLLVILIGMVGVRVSRFDATVLAKFAFGLAAAVFLIPLVSFALWPADFQPGFAKVLMLNLAFVGMFAGSGLLFRHAASRSDGGRRAPAAG
ncbi:MAG TPA: hypothetical protein VG734_14150 [Lacunisphaera sp.]|nr:hypothetical protein [Lacunisphaera sp.]